LTFEPGCQLSVLCDSAFSGCSSLRSICIPSSVTELRAFCFKGCKTLSVVRFDRNCRVATFRAYIFEGCDSLLAICIPASVWELTAMSLARSRIESITVDHENRFFKVCNCFLVDFAGTCLLRYFGKEGEVTIGEDIVGISRGCFSYCDSISSVRFEPGCQITALSESAFECSSLESICIPASVLTIATDCFRTCLRLSAVTFEAGSQASKIGDSAFAECPSLRAIRLPA
jgi:hypothetical protein